MLKGIEIAVLAALLPVSSAIAVTHVSFDELAKHPQRYNGRIVEVTAWLQVDTAHKIASLRPRPHADMSDLPEILVNCLRWVPDSQIYAAAHKRVQIRRRFEYRDMRDRQRIGFGWGGIFDNSFQAYRSSPSSDDCHVRI
jgi:hypothetical protein